MAIRLIVMVMCSVIIISEKQANHTDYRSYREHWGRCCVFNVSNVRNPGSIKLRDTLLISKLLSSAIRISHTSLWPKRSITASGLVQTTTPIPPFPISAPSKKSGAGLFLTMACCFACSFFYKFNYFYLSRLKNFSPIQIISKFSDIF